MILGALDHVDESIHGHGQHVVHRVTEVDPLGDHLDATRVEPRRREQIIDDVAELAGLGLDEPDPTDEVLDLQVVVLANQHLRPADDRGERGADLMADRCEELHAGAVRPFERPCDHDHERDRHRPEDGVGQTRHVVLRDPRRNREERNTGNGDRTPADGVHHDQPGGAQRKQQRGHDEHVDQRRTNADRVERDGDHAETDHRDVERDRENGSKSRPAEPPDGVGEDHGGEQCRCNGTRPVPT